MHQKALGRQPSRYITEFCEEFSKELWDSDKSFVSQFLKFQDQGCILIMHHAHLHIASSLLCDLMLIIRSIKKRVQSIFKRSVTNSCFPPSKLALHWQVPHSSSEVDKFADETVVCSKYNAIVVKMLIIIS